MVWQLGNSMLLMVYPLDEVEALFLFASYSPVLLVENKYLESSNWKNIQ